MKSSGLASCPCSTVRLDVPTWLSVKEARSSLLLVSTSILSPSTTTRRTTFLTKSRTADGGAVDHSSACFLCGRMRRCVSSGWSPGSCETLHYLIRRLQERLQPERNLPFDIVCWQSNHLALPVGTLEPLLAKHSSDISSRSSPCERG